MENERMKPDDPPRDHRAAVPAILALALLAGCGGAPPAPPAPSVDQAGIAREAERASALDAPYRLVFQWSLVEPGLRVSGRGVARVEPPYRARLDLFASSGERIATAALVGDDLRVPTGMPAVMPPAPLLWGTLGVFRPGDRTSPAGGTLDGDDRSALRYRLVGGGELEVRLLGERVERMQLDGADGARQEVRVTLPAGERFPREAVYRHHGATRELRLTLESVEHVESYPSDIWSPGS